GTVDDIHIFHTELMTADNRVVIVPNRLITGSAITNFSKKDTRRVDMIVTVGYGTDLAQAKALLEQIVKADEPVLPEPEPTSVVGHLGGYGGDILVRPWSQASDYWGLKWDLWQTMKTRLEQDGISVANQHMHVHLVRDAGDAPKQSVA